MVSIIAWRRISSLPERAKLSRAPAFTSPSVRVWSSIEMTWAFWLSMIQANRRLVFTASSPSGHNRRMSANPMDPPAGAPAAPAPAGAAAGAPAGASAEVDPAAPEADDAAEVDEGVDPAGAVDPDGPLDVERAVDV